MGGTWSRDGTIVFAPDFYAPLHSVSASGGTSNPLRKLDEAHREISHRWPVFLPDGRHYLFRVVSPVTHRSGIYVGSLTSETPQFLFNASSNTVYVSPGFLLYLREGTLMAQRFDPETLEIIGQAVPVVDQVDYDPGFSRGAFSVSQEGSLVYSQNSRESRHLAWYDRQGNRVVTVGDKDYYEHFSISPDGTKVALDRRATHSKTTDIWVIDLDLKTTSRFTFDNDVDSFPIWSPDGARIVFSSDRKGSLDLFQKPVAGDHEEELLLSCEAEVRPLDWSSDNRYVLYERTSVDTRSDLWVLPLFGERWRIEGDRLALLEIMLTVLW
jgi:Tol biopolymer transport system component